MRQTDYGIEVCSNTEVAQLSNSLEKGGNIKLIPDPINKGGFPSSEMLMGLVPEISEALKRTDMIIFKKDYPFVTPLRSELERWVWDNNPPRLLFTTWNHPETSSGWETSKIDSPQGDSFPQKEGPSEKVDTYEIPPLWALILRKVSPWRMAFGLINGRPIHVTARAELYPLKYMKVVLQQNKTTHLVNEKGRAVLRNLTPALAHLYRMIGVESFEQIVSHIDVENDLMGMYLGSASGANHGQVREIRTGNAKKVLVSPHGKKFEMHGFDLDVFLKLVREGKDIPVYWVISPKSEIFYSFDKQWCDLKWQKFCDKCRVFVIPSSNFVILERLVSKVRMLRERGPCIRIGHRWSFGGMDEIAKCLGIGLANCFESLLCDGDIDKFDMRVKAFFMNLYYSAGMVHEKPGSEDYELKKQIIKKIIKAIIARVTQLFGEAWCIQRGGMPSGCFNTSHADSWIMALYFVLFCVWQILNAPEEHKVLLEEEFIKYVRLIVYGDDHVYNKGTGLAATYFSTPLFAKFLEECFEVELRDHRNGVPFCSREWNGWLIGDPGMVFLRHYSVINPYRNDPKLPGQANFLPYRETREYVCRAVWGREPKERDILDTMLSVLGHVYGTHGSNRNAYNVLKAFYGQLLRYTGKSAGSVAADELVNRVDRNDLRKMRQHGMTMEDIRTGFPKWSTLVKRNVYDQAYQNTIVDFDDNEDVVDIDTEGY